MNKNTLVLLSVLSLFSCGNSKENSKEYENLLIQIAKLKEQNRNLSDSLANIEKENLYSQILIGITEEPILKVGKKNRIKFLFNKYDSDLPNYSIYKIEGVNEIKIGENKKTEFNYEFIPKSINDNQLDLRIKMPYKGKIIEIPAGMKFKVEK